MKKHRSFTGLIAATGPLLLGCALPAQATTFSPIKISLVDEQSQPLAGITINGFFNKTVEEGGFLMFQNTVRKTDPFTCVTDIAGQCAVTAPVDYRWTYDQSTITHQRMTDYNISGALTSVSIDKLQGVDVQKMTSFYTPWSAGDLTPGRVNLKFILKDQSLRLTRMVRIPTQAALSDKLVATDTADEIQFNTYAAHALWNDPLNMYGNTAYVQSQVSKASGAAQFSIVATNTNLGQLNPLTLVVMRDVAEYTVVAAIDGKEITLPLASVRFDDEIVYGKLVQVMWFKVPESLLRTIVRNYAEGSDQAFTFEIRGLRENRVRRSIPHFEIVAMLARVASLGKKQD